jgi:hypothetical protein
MTRVKKSLLIVLALLLLTQIPFAYRRYKLGRLNAVIQVVNSSRKPPDNSSAFDFLEYQGVIHVHSFLGGHSTGTFQEIIEAAKANNLDFVIMTEHVESEFDTSAMTLSGTHGSTLFINGNEVDTASGDHLLSIPGDVSLTGFTKLSTNDAGANARARGALSIIAYPEQFNGSTENLDGVEVYNVFTNARRINRLVAFFDALWSHHSYPDLLFANYFRRPEESLRKWDEMLAHKKLVATAGNDSHSNIGITLNDSSGNELLGFKLDPYKTSFHLVRVHVLTPGTFHGPGARIPLKSERLIEALRQGHCFIGFDLFGDTSGFRFTASNASGTRIQGDEIPFQNDTRLRVTLPVSSRLRIFRNGGILWDENGVNEKDFKITERGVYRVEAYLPQLGSPVGEQPWIVSNPIFVR